MEGMTPSPLPEEATREARAEKTGEATRFVRARSHEARRTASCRLAEGEHAASSLHEHVPLSPSALSRHPAVLRREGLVATPSEAQTIYYRLADTRARRLVGVPYALFCTPSGRAAEA